MPDDGAQKTDVAHRRFILFGIGGVIVLIVAITLTGLKENLSYFLYPTEAVDQRADFPDGERFHLAGLVVTGSVEEAEDLHFSVTDGGATIDVVLTEPAPSLFGEDVPVLLEGSWSGQVFVADNALIRHDENYEIPDQGGGYDVPEDGGSPAVS